MSQGRIAKAMSDNMRGAMFMALAMATFACNDALVKTVTASLGIGQIMAVRGLMTTALVYGVTRYIGAGISFRALLHPLVLLRTVCELAATTLYFSALKHLEFATAASIMQALPLVVTLGAAVIFGEPVGWRRWTAITVGFIGVLMIVGPGREGLDPACFYALGALVATACRDLVTRRIGAHIPSIGITLFAAIGNAVLGLALVPVLGGWQPIEPSHLALLALMAALVFAGYQSVIMAMRMGDISFVAPFRYTSLLWGLVIGTTLFSERPDGWMLAGAAIVISSGIYSFYREARRKQAIAASTVVAPPGSVSGPLPTEEGR